MRHTLLQVVQAVLNDMDSDAVNSINDTEESSQVVSIARDVFMYMVDEYQLPSNKRIIQAGDAGVGKPNYFKIPDNVKRVEWLRYDCRLDSLGNVEYNSLTYLPPVEFIYLVTKRNSTDTSIDTVTDPVTNIPMFIYNDRHPTYWTSFDDKYIVVDAYNSDIDAEVQVSKSMMEVEQAPTWAASDSFEIPLPDHLQSLYLSEVKSTCFVTLKQVENAKVEQQAARLRFNVQGQKDRTDIRHKRPNYGRR